MRTLIIGRGIPTAEYPINGVFEYEQAVALAKQDIEVYFVAIDLRSFRRKRKWGIHSYKVEKLNIIELNIPLGRIPRKMLIHIGSMVLKNILKNKIRMSEKDIIHAHFMDVAEMTRSVIKNANNPLIIREHSSLIAKMDKNHVDYSSIKELYSSADLVLGVSNSFCNHLTEIFGVETKCVGNVVDTSAFTYENKKVEKEFVFVTAGRLVPGKSIDLLIEAFSRISTSNDNVYLKIIGYGPEKENLIKLVSTKKLEEKIEFCGTLTKSEINEQYKNAHCFVLPSKAETFGVVYIEAMTSGLPIIVTKCGGPEDFINENNGIMVEVDNVDELALAMQNMIINYESYNYALISKQAIEKYSPESISNQLIELYQNLKNDKKS